MDFLIADTFTTSLGKLTGEEQKQVKTTAFDLQVNPSNPGLSFHKLDRAKDKSFWSVRVSRDLRIIVHRTDSSLLMCYVGHHDSAYRWAERRKIAVHPKTGAAQIVEIRERVEEVRIPSYVAAPVEPDQDPSKPKLFADYSDESLLLYGVPEEWLSDVKNADEDELLKLADHLPAEAAEALLELATGGIPAVSVAQPAGGDPFAHPDAQRRFRVMSNSEELARALDYPWEKWTVFLHPAQRQVVEKDFNGPARVAGSAGTGKTIVALHRAVHLARKNPEARVLLTTFSDTLANSLKNKLRRLTSDDPRLSERLEVHALDSVGEKLFKPSNKNRELASISDILSLLKEAKLRYEGGRFTERFLLGEWTDVVDAWQLDTWESYRDVKRLGRKTRLPEQQRVELWKIFEWVKSQLAEQELVTHATMFTELAEEIEGRKVPPFEFAIVDEAQDLSVAQLRFLAALGKGRSNALFFAGDLGQRIFQTPFSWKSLGVDIRGRSRTLKINYRTSHQIRKQADRLLGADVSDVDGNVDDRRGTVSVFNGPDPHIEIADSTNDEASLVGNWLTTLVAEGFLPHELGIFVRTTEQLVRAVAAAETADIPFRTLDENMDTTSGKLSISTMHLAKGLEFRAVVVMACDDEVLPLQERIESISDNADLDEVYETERHLLYVACTRAREALLLTGTDPVSEFLDDLIDKY